jgi:PAS domain S-box-containing protein
MDSTPTDFSTLFDALPIGAYRSRPDGKMVRANAALVRLNGYASEAELLAGVHDIAREWYVEPTRRAEFSRQLEAEGRVVAFVSEVFRHRTRERIWISENAHVVRDAEGRPRYYEGTVEEITERVHTEQALQRSEARLQQLVALIPGAVFRVAVADDGRHHYTFMSEGVRALYGVTPEEALRDSNALTRRRHPEDTTDVAERERALRERRARDVEIRVRLDDGSEKWVQVISAPAPAEDGHEVRVGVLFDITERKEAEALRLERDRAAAADLAKTQFLSRVSHELRTPLNAVLGFGQLLELEPGGGERQAGWVGQLLASGRHLLALLDDILDLSSVQSGELPLEPESVPLGPLVEEAVTMLAAAAQEAGVAVRVDIAAEHDLVVRADRRRLRQVTANLLSNAIKYNRPGGSVRLHAERDADAVCLHVTDSGAGLDAEQQARLFRPFERLGAQRSAVPGTGLGLALSRQLAEAMDGSLSVRSRPGAGSTFSVCLPRA